MSGNAAVAVIGAGTGLAIGLIVRYLNNKALRQLRRARKEFLKAVRQRLPITDVFTVDGNFKHPVIWITTASDFERDRLRQDENVPDQFRTALVHVGYSTEDIPLAQFVFESQQTVNRDFGGSWSKRRYAWARNNY